MTTFPEPKDSPEYLSVPEGGPPLTNPEKLPERFPLLAAFLSTSRAMSGAVDRGAIEMTETVRPIANTEAHFIGMQFQDRFRRAGNLFGRTVIGIVEAGIGPLALVEAVPESAYRWREDREVKESFAERRKAIKARFSGEMMGRRAQADQIALAKGKQFENGEFVGNENEPQPVIEVISRLAKKHAAYLKICEDFRMCMGGKKFFEEQEPAAREASRKHLEKARELQSKANKWRGVRNALATLDTKRNELR